MLHRWLAAISADERKQWFELVAKDLEEGGKIFGSKIIKVISLSDWEKNVAEAEAAATQGKYLINLLDA